MDCIGDSWAVCHQVSHCCFSIHGTQKSTYRLENILGNLLVFIRGNSEYCSSLKRNRGEYGIRSRDIVENTFSSKIQGIL